MIPKHLRELVIRQEPREGGAWVCLHGRPLSACAVCAPEAERRYREASSAQPAAGGGPKT